MPHPEHKAEAGRARTLKEVGRIVHTLGLATRPLSAAQVFHIERRALNKLKRQACQLSCIPGN